MKISLLLFASSLPSAALSSSFKNVYGNALQSCSSDGMALTGYTRTGYCVDQNDDQGSHHICIDLSSASGGNFCDVTGQDDWCSSEMPCHEDQDEYCQVQQWCVCQWAFASYLENAGGCSYIQTVVCNAINMEAVLAYRKQSSSSKYQEALDCLVERCGLDLSSSMYLNGSSGAVSTSWLRLGLVAGSLVALAGAIVYLRRRTYKDIDKEARLVDQSSSPIM